MAVLDEDFCTDLTTPEGGDTLWSLPFVVPAYEPLDWESLLEQAERASRRNEAARTWRNCAAIEQPAERR